MGYFAIENRQKNAWQIPLPGIEGKGIEEKAYIASCNHESYKIEVGKEVLSVDPDYFRPTEVESLIGDPTKAKEKLGWTPDYDLLSLIKDMMQSDLNSLKL